MLVYNGLLQLVFYCCKSFWFIFVFKEADFLNYFVVFTKRLECRVFIFLLFHSAGLVGVLFSIYVKESLFVFPTASLPRLILLVSVAL